MVKEFKFGHKPARKKWDASEIDKEWEKKKITIIVFLLPVFFILLGLFYVVG